ncbi:MAG: hypothetical protein IIU28_07765 [Lachnospiraceae bacterium]|nr:hypothetical protein [Lachnospiraceae bacterium]
MNFKKHVTGFLGITAVVIASVLISATTPVQAKVAKSLTSTSLLSTELTKNNGSIKVQIDNTRKSLTFTLKGCRQYSGRAITCDHELREDSGFSNILVDENGNASLKADLSSLKESTNSLWAYRSNKTYSTDMDYSSMSYTGFLKLSIKKSSGQYFFYSPAGKNEKAFRESLDKNYSPKTKRSPYYTQNLTYGKKIKAKTKAIIKNCKTRSEKIKAIHDWLGKNIQYNYAALYAPSGSNIQWNSADPDWVFKNKKAVCSGYARLARVMYTYAGVPCLNIVGTAQSGLTSGTDYNTPNHEWNAVYLSGSWRILDITWDSPNKYYGKNDQQNIKGEAPRYTYYGITPFVLGMDHISLSVS